MINQKTFNSLEKNNNQNQKNKMFLFIGICVALIVSAYFLLSIIWGFPDAIQLCRQSICFWDVLFEGKMSIFYDYLSTQGKWLYGSWISSLPLSIGIFPLYLIEKITGKEHVLFNVLYFKTFLFINLIILCGFVYKIVLFFRENDRKSAIYSALFVFGSLEILDSIGYAGQDEIIYLLFYAVGLYFLLKQKHILCLVFFTFSVTSCPIMIIPIFCNFLMYYKNIFRLSIYLIVLVIPSALFELAYRHDSAWQIEKVQNTLGTFQTMMTTGTITSSVGPVPIAFVVIVIVAILSYLVRKDEENKDIKCIRYSAVIFFALSFLTSVTFYRYCIYVPIFAILFGISDKSIDLKGFLLFLIGILRFGYSLINGCNMEYRFLSSITVKIFGEKVLANGTDMCIINRFSGLVDSGFFIIRPVVIGCGLYYLFLSFREDDYVFPIKAKLSVLFNSMAGLALAAFTIYQIMTSFS